MGQKRGSVLGGFLHCGGFDGAVAANGHGEGGQGYGGLNGFGAEGGEEGADVLLVLAGVGLFGPAFVLPAEGVEGGAAEGLAMAEQAEHWEGEAAGDGDLAATAGCRVEAGEERRCEVEDGVLAVFGGGVEAGDFVLVFDGHDAEGGFGHGARKGAWGAGDGGLAGDDCIDEGAVAAGQSRVLVTREFGGAAVDKAGEVGGFGFGVG